MLKIVHLIPTENKSLITTNRKRITKMIFERARKRIDEINHDADD